MDRLMKYPRSQIISVFIRQEKTQCKKGNPTNTHVSCWMIDFSLTSYCVHTGFSIIRIRPFLNLALRKTLGHNMFLKVFIMILLFVLDFVYHSYLYFISNSLSSTHSYVFCGLDNVTGITILTNPYWISTPLFISLLT